MRPLSIVVSIALVFVAWPAAAHADFEQGQRAFDRGDFAAAREAWQPLAENGDRRAQLELGRLLNAHADMEGMRWIRASAGAGYLPAEFEMGFLHSRGLYLPRDWSQEEAWLKSAIGHPKDEEAEFRADAALARLLLAMGRVARSPTGGHDKDYGAVVPLIREAADAGDRAAQFYYAYLFENGMGVDRDLIEAHKYYVLCGRQGGLKGGKGIAEASAARVRDLSKQEDFVQSSDKRVLAWLEARDAGEHGWIYDLEDQLSAGRKALSEANQRLLVIAGTLQLAASDASCAEDRVWVRSRAVVGSEEVGADRWVERWTLDVCGKAKAFSVVFRRDDSGVHWELEGGARPGADDPESLVAGTCVMITAGNFEGLLRLVAPDELPLLSFDLIMMNMVMRAMFLDPHHGEPSKELVAKAELLEKETNAVLRSHGIDPEAFAKKAPRDSGSAAEMAAWWKALAPDVDHTALITDMLAAREKLAEHAVGPGATFEFERFCGTLMRLKMESGGAKAEIRDWEVHFREIDGRWFLSPAAEAGPTGLSGWDDEQDATFATWNDSAFERGKAARDRGEYAKALAAWRPLAERGGREAQQQLGHLYEEGGHGVPTDLIEAHKWYVLAWKRDLDTARHRALAVRKRLTAEQFTESQRRIRAWIDQGEQRDDAPLYPIFVKNKWGLIDATGRVVIPARYDAIGRAASRNSTQKRSAAELCDLLDSEMWPIREALIGVKLEDGWRFVARDGSEVGGRFDFVGRFSEGLGLVVQGKKAGFVDRSGTVVIPPQFDGALRFEDGAAPARSGTKWGLIDRTGEYVLAPTFDKVWPGLAKWPRGLFRTVSNGKLGIATSDGRVILPARFDFDQIRRVSEGLVPVKESGKWGYLDVETGAVVIDMKFDAAEGFEGGVALVRLDDREGYIDREGNFTAPPSRSIWDSMYDFHGTFKRFRQDGKGGILDASTGKIVVEAKYKSINDVYEGRASFRDAKDHVGYLNETGAVVIEPRFGMGLRFSSGLAAVSVDSLFGYIDRTGVTVIKPHLENPHHFRGALVLVVDQDGRRFRYMNKDGQTVYSFPRPCPEELSTWDLR